MKKIIAILLALSTIFMFGCGKKDTNTGETKKIEKKESKNEFYNSVVNNDNRPIAIMIDNDNNSARPQIGLENAYLVYEIIVEGGASRFMALFKDYNLEKIGPIRSSRHYFLDYVMENDAIYAHCGFSPRAAKDIPALGINNINGVKGDDCNNFWRDNTYDNTWHNLYTSTKKLSDYAKNKKNYEMKGNELVLDYYTEEKEISGNNATQVTLPYSGFYKVGYTYNADKKLYERSVNNNAHVSQTGDVLTAKNIIIYQVDNTDLNDGEAKGRQEVYNTGNGTGWYLCNGKSVEITWEKTDRKTKTKYKTKDGKALTINPGNTYIQIVPKNQTVTIQ